MRRLLVTSLLLSASLALAQDDLRKPAKSTKDADLGKKGASVAPDKSLAGDLTRKKEEGGKAAPALQYDQFRLGVELQVRSKRVEQIASLKKIIEISNPKDKEMPSLLFRQGELYWEESKYYFFEANRKDDDLINAMNRKDKAGQEKAKREKEELLAQSKEYAGLATEQYSQIVQSYKDFERTDEVLYFLGHNLMEMGEDRKALVAYKRLVEKFPKSKFLPDSYLAFGEYYFNNSKGKREMLEKALEAYKKAASYPENQVYGFALYKQGWCYFNLAEYQKAMDQFKAVVLYAKFAGEAAIEKDGGGGPNKSKASLAREARNDFVRAYARGGGSPTEARAEFGKLADKPEDRFTMMKQLANLFYEDGKDKEAAITFNTLIKEKPLSPEAPGFQGKIVDCVLRAGNKKMTVDQVRRLVKVMDDVVKNNPKLDEKGKKSLEEARELSERTISNLAVNWHNEAKKTRDEETFGFANEVYSDYLTLFPENPKAYDLRFFWAELLNDNLQKYEKAAEEYTKVFAQDIRRMEGEKNADGKVVKGKPGKWMVNAAYNAILAYDEVVKKAEEAGQLKKDPAASDITKKQAIPAQKKSLLEACERYVKYIPNGDKRVEIAFKAAKIYYDYNYLDEAVKRFSDIAINYPDYKFENGDRAGEVAANLVLDSYNLLGDWTKVNEWARRFYKEEKLASGKFREELSRVIEQSAFKLVNQLEARKEFSKAAEAYLSFVNEFPKSDLADEALHNAAIDFFNGKMLDKAIETRNRIIQHYPRSQFVPADLFANAEGHEAIGDFEEAAEEYERYVAGYERSKSGGDRAPAKRKPVAKKGKKGKADKDDAPKKDEKGGEQVWEESKAQIALYNAGVFRDGLGQYKQALKDRERYLELWPDSKDAEAVFLSIADLYEKTQAYGKATKQLEDYERKYLRDPNKVLMAEGRIANIFEHKLKKAKDAARINDRILSYYDKLNSAQKKKLEPAALDAVGHAHFLSNEVEYRHYMGLKLRWTKLTAIAEFKKSVQEKALSMKQIEKIYTATVNLKSADPAICALYRMGMAAHNFADSLVNVKMPKGVPPELETELRAQFDQEAQAPKNHAAELFAAAVQKSNELDVANECSTSALKLLRESYRPDQFPKMGEEVAEVKSVKAMSVGQDVLSAIQPIPVVTAGQLQENREKARELKEEFKDVKAKNTPPPDEEEVSPSNDSSDEDTSDEPRAQKGAPGKASAKAAASTEEPGEPEL